MAGMDAVRLFAELVARPDPPLDQAALALAAGADPALDPTPWLAELDRLAAGVGSLDELRHRLFTEAAFAGNERDYHDPRNSLLNHVLARRLGIPITLAVVTIEVGRRAGVALEGVGMPGHFLVRAVGTTDCLDVFAGGRPLSPAECEHRFRAVTGAGPEVPFGPHLLTTASTTAILTRMLQNLRAVFQARHRVFDLEWVLRMRLLLPGAGLPEVLELADTLGAQTRWEDGARLLEQQLPGLDPAPAGQLRAAARGLRAHLN
jgi:regulator of sirC expression with transglutaminase-like and TPR domain